MELFKYIRDCVKDADGLYLSSMYYGPLVKYNYNDRKIGLVCTFPWIKWKGDTYTYLYKKYVVICALHAYQIGIYDKEKHKAYAYVWKDEDETDSCYACIYGEWIYFFPACNEKIIKFNLAEKKYQVVLDLSSRSYLKEKQFVYADRYGDNVYLTEKCSNEIYIYNLAQNTFEESNIKFDENIFAMSIVNNILYATSSQYPILYTYDLDIDKCQKHIYKGEGRFAKPTSCQGGVLLFSEKKLVYWKDGVFVDIDFPNEIIGENTWSFCSFDINNEVSVLFPWTSDYIYEIDFSGYRVVRVKKSLCPECMLIMHTRHIKESAESYTLENYIEAIKSWNY